MSVFPEIEMWSTNDKLPDNALTAMIEASNAYAALCKFQDPVNTIYAEMLLKVGEFLPQLLQIAVDHKVAVAAERERCARICDSFAELYRYDNSDASGVATELAKRIRGE